MFEPNHAVLARFKARKPQTVDQFAEWVAEERKKDTDQHRLTQTNSDTRTTIRDNSKPSVKVGERPCQSLSSSCLAANGVLSLLNLACYLLNRQVERLARDFENEGGFTERLYKVRTAKQRGHR